LAFQRAEGASATTGALAGKFAFGRSANVASVEIMSPAIAAS
jgi:hypothetical protein